MGNVPHAGNRVDLTTRGADGAAVDQITDELMLRDGQRMIVRPIRPADASLLTALHARLSPDSVYRRYFGTKPVLSAAETRRFTQIAEPWRFALVGVSADGQLGAVARYEGEPGQVDAEIALIVDDQLHHLGLGRLLLQRLIDVAVARGMTSLTAIVLASNVPMLHLLSALPVPSASVRDGLDVEVTLALSELRLPADREHIAAAHLADAAVIRASLTS
jgi:GNAT superfamily N-acetyltransferase